MTAFGPPSAPLCSTPCSTGSSTLALEPWVRRKWPRTMISWTRYTSRGASDPLVGRDLLYGTVLGAILTVGWCLGRCAKRQQPSTLVSAAERIARRALGTRRRLAGHSRRHLHRPAVLLHALPAAPRAAQRVDRGTGVRGHHHRRDHPCQHHAMGRLPAECAGLRHVRRSPVALRTAGRHRHLRRGPDSGIWRPAGFFGLVCGHGDAAIPAGGRRLLVYGFRVSLAGRTLFKQEL